jgi:hypothetical protein
METLIRLLLISSGFIAGYYLKYYFPSYLGEKGKNLATKEDIAKITASAILAVDAKYHMPFAHSV